MQSSLVITSGWGKETWELPLYSNRVLFGWWKVLETSIMQQWCLYNIVNLINATESYS